MYDRNKDEKKVHLTELILRSRQNKYQTIDHQLLGIMSRLFLPYLTTSLKFHGLCIAGFFQSTNIISTPNILK
jgi:hypothetical protein